MAGLRTALSVEAITAEREVVEKVRAFVRLNAKELSLIAGWGDGRCGYIAELFCEGLNIPDYSPKASKKEKINRKLAKQVFERDAYRCVTCGSHIDLTCDHLIAESKGGETSFENLQTMCRPCNSKKGAA